MQSKNPMVDGVARLMTEAAGMADGVRREAETVMHSQLQRFLAEQELVSRDEFDAVKDIAVKALEEVAVLKAEIENLKDQK